MRRTYSACLHLVFLFAFMASPALFAQSCPTGPLSGADLGRIGGGLDLTGDRLVSAYWESLNAPPDEREEAHAEAVDRFRACLRQLDTTLRNQSGFPLTNSSTNPGFAASAMGLSAHLKTLEALTYLYPSDLERQDPQRARQLIQQAVSRFNVDVRDAASRIQEFHVQQAMRQRRAQMIGAVIGTAIGSQVLDVSTSDSLRYLLGELERIESDFSVTVEPLFRDAAPHGEVRWSPEGVRLHVFRLSGEQPLSPVVARSDHTQHVVRVVSTNQNDRRSQCTGGYIGDGLVITAQHCIQSRDGRRNRDVVVLHDYSYPRTRDLGRLLELRDTAVEFRVQEIATPSESWADSWEHDWAVLRIQIPARFNPDFINGWSNYALFPIDLNFAYAIYLAEGIPLRISVAGYSSDVDEGRYITMDWGCEVSGRGGRIVQHSCRGWRGMSGAPIVIANGPLKGAMVAIHAFGDGSGRDSGSDSRGGGPELHGPLLEEVARMRGW